MRRLFSFILGVFFFASQCVFAHSAEANVWAERRRSNAPRAGGGNAFQFASLARPLAGRSRLSATEPAIPPSIAEAAPFIDPDAPLAKRLAPYLHRLPANAGRVRRIHVPADASEASRIVFHIQDVHRNDEAQENIARLVRALSAAGPIDLVGLEGASEPIDVSRYQSHPDRALVELTAGALRRNFDISGPVHAAMTASLSFPALVGVEERADYERNIAAYRASLDGAEDAGRQVAAAAAAVSREKSVAYGRRLKEIDALVQAWRRQTLGFPDYLEALAAHSAPSPAVSDFLRAVSLEASLEIEHARRERRELLEMLAGRLSRTELTRLANAGIAFQSGELDHRAFHGVIEAMTRAHGLSIADAPHFAAYLRYLDVADRVDAATVMAAAREMEMHALRTAALTETERRLIEEDAKLFLMGRLLDFSLTPVEWTDLRALARGEDRAAFSPYFDFYEAAEERNRALSRNLIESMEPKKGGAAILVAGGFHSPGINEWLEKASTVVVEIAPVLTAVETPSGAQPLSAFAQVNTPLENLFEGRALFLADAPATPLVLDVKGPATALGIQTLRAGTGLAPEADGAYRFSRLSKGAFAVGARLAAPSRAIVGITRKGAGAVRLAVRRLDGPVEAYAIESETAAAGPTRRWRRAGEWIRWPLLFASVSAWIVAPLPPIFIPIVVAALIRRRGGSDPERLLDAYQSVKTDLFKASLNKDRAAYRDAWDRMSVLLGRFQPYIANEEPLKRAVDTLNAGLANPIHSADEVLEASGLPFEKSLRGRVARLAEEFADWFSDEKLTASRKIALAARLQSITTNFSFASLVQREPAFMGPQAALALAHTFDNFRMVRALKGLAVTQGIGNDVRIAVRYLPDVGGEMFDASVLHEFVHAASFWGVLPLTSKNEVITHAVTFTRLLESSRADLIRDFMEEHARAETLANRLFDAGGYPDPVEDTQAFIGFLFEHATRAFGVDDPEDLERLTGSVLAQFLWRTKASEADPAARALSLYRDLISMAFRVEPSASVDGMSPRDLNKVRKNLAHIANVFRSQFGKAGYTFEFFEMSDQWAIDDDRKIVGVPLRLLLHPNLDVINGGAFDFIARYQHIDRSPVEADLKKNVWFNILYDVFRIRHARRAFANSRGSTDAASGWIRTYINYQFADPLGWAKVRMAKLPAYAQFFEALYYTATFGKPDPRISDERVLDLLIELRDPLARAFKEPDTRTYYDIVKNEIWPAVEGLIRDELEKMAESLNLDDASLEKMMDALGKSGGLPLGNLGVPSPAGMGMPAGRAPGAASPAQSGPAAESAEAGDRAANKGEGGSDGRGGEPDPEGDAATAESSAMDESDEAAGRGAPGETPDDDAAGASLADEAFEDPVDWAEVPTRITEAAHRADAVESELSPNERSWYDLKVEGVIGEQINDLKRVMEQAFPLIEGRGRRGGRPQGLQIDNDNFIVELKTGGSNFFEEQTRHAKKPDVYITVIIDLTGSMSFERIRHAQLGLALLLESIMGRESVHISAFGYSTEYWNRVDNINGFPVFLPMTEGAALTRDRIVRAVAPIEGFVGGGNHRDINALRTGIKILQESGGRRSSRHIFYLSDGDAFNQFDRKEFFNVRKKAEEEEGIYAWGIYLDHEGKEMIHELFSPDRSFGGPASRLGDALGEALMSAARASGRYVLTASFLRALFERRPRLTAWMIAPLVENGFVIGPALILKSVPGAGPVLAAAWIVAASALLAFRYHKELLGTALAEPVRATAGQKAFIFLQFVASGFLGVGMGYGPTAEWGRIAGLLWHAGFNMFGPFYLMAGFRRVKAGETTRRAAYIETDASGRDTALVIHGEKFPVSDWTTKDRVPPDRFYDTATNRNNAQELSRLIDRKEKPVIMTGDHGTGKDFLIRSVANARRQNVRLMPFHEDMATEDLFFKRSYDPDKEEVTDEYSDLVMAAIEGQGLVLGEYNKLRGEARLALLPILEDAYQKGKIDLPNGKTVRVHPDFWAVATLNEGPGYAVEPLDPADSDRWAWLTIDYLPPAEEVRFLKSLIDQKPFKEGGRYEDVPELLAEINSVIVNLVQKANVLRSDFRTTKGQRVPRPLSTRVLERIVKHLNAYPEDVYFMGTVLRRNYNMDFQPENVKQYVSTVLSQSTNLVDRTNARRYPEFTLDDLRYEFEGDHRYLVLGDARVLAGEDTPESVEKALADEQVDLSSDDLYRLWWILKDKSLGLHSAFIGYKGAGKSVTSKLIGKLLNGDTYVSINFNEDTEPYHYITRRSYKQNRFFYEELSLPYAMRNDKVTRLVEFNTARPRSTAILNEVFARNELNTPDPEAKPIRAPRGAGFSMIVEMNPPVKGYRKRHGMSNEVWDRMPVDVFDYPNPVDERRKMAEILSDPEFDPIIHQLVNFANIIRTHLVDGKMGDAPSMRFTTQWARHLKAYPDDIDAFPELIDRYFHVDDAPDRVKRNRAMYAVGLHRHFLEPDREVGVLEKAVPAVADENVRKFIAFFTVLRKRYVSLPDRVSAFPLKPSRRLLQSLLQELEAAGSVDDLVNEPAKLFPLVNSFFAARYVMNDMRDIWLQPRSDAGVNMHAEQVYVAHAFKSVFNDAKKMDDANMVVPDSGTELKGPELAKALEKGAAALAPESDPDVDAASDDSDAEIEISSFDRLVEIGILDAEDLDPSDLDDEGGFYLEDVEIPLGGPTGSSVDLPAADPRLAKGPPPSFEEFVDGVMDDVRFEQKYGNFKLATYEHDAPISRVVPHLSEPNTVFIGDDSGRAFGIDVQTNRTFFGFDTFPLQDRVPARPISALATANAGMIVILGVGSLIVFVDRQTKTHVPGRLSMNVKALDVNPRGNVVAIGGGVRATGGRPGYGQIVFRSVRGKPMPVTLADTDDIKHASPITALRWSPTGRFIVSGDESGRILIWDVKRKRAVHKIDDHSNAVTALSWDPDGKRFHSSGLDLSVRGISFDVTESGDLDAATVDSLTPAIGIPTPVVDIVAAPNGRIVFGARSNQVKLFTTEGYEIKPDEEMVADETQGLTSVGVLADGNSIVSGSKSGNLYIWRHSPERDDPTNPFGATDGLKIGAADRLVGAVGYDAAVFLETLVLWAANLAIGALPSAWLFFPSIIALAVGFSAYHIQLSIPERRALNRRAFRWRAFTSAALSGAFAGAAPLGAAAQFILMHVIHDAVLNRFLARKDYRQIRTLIQNAESRPMSQGLKTFLSPFTNAGLPVKKGERQIQVIELSTTLALTDLVRPALAWRSAEPEEKRDVVFYVAPLDGTPEGEARIAAALTSVLNASPRHDSARRGALSTLFHSREGGGRYALERLLQRAHQGPTEAFYGLVRQPLPATTARVAWVLTAPDRWAPIAGRAVRLPNGVTIPAAAMVSYVVDLLTRSVWRVPVETFLKAATLAKQAA